MKKYYLLLICGLFLCPMGVQAQLELGLGYDYAQPLGGMSLNITQVHGLSLYGRYHLPNSPIALGAEINYGHYGHQKSRQFYTFNDGSQVETDVHVNNNIASLNLTAQIDLLQKGAVIPYFLVKSGASFFYTDLRIDDPTDRSDCEVLEQDLLQSDWSVTASTGLGFRWDLASLVSKWNQNTFFVNFQAEYQVGSTVNYMSVDRPNRQNRPRGDVEASFVNSQTQVVHRHHVGHVYQSSLEMLRFRLGMSVNINNLCN